MRTVALALLSSLVFTIPSRAFTIRVPADQPTIQAGINSANSGDSVLVAPGTYTGGGNKNLNTKGKAIVLHSESGADATTIDCEGQGRGFYFQAGETPSTIVQGFTIENGTVDGGFPSGWGGGILCVGSSPMIRDFVIRGCTGTGGGIAFYDSAPQVRNCTITQNIGGAGYVHSSVSATFESCTFSANTGGSFTCLSNSVVELVDCTFSANGGNGTNQGGAIFCGDNASVSATSCTFSGNSASSLGGAIYCSENASVSATSCTFSGNSVLSRGGAILVLGTTPTLADCTFIGNTANQGGALYLDASSPLTIDSCLFDGNQANQAGQGGAVFCISATANTLIGCFFFNNSALSGGAIYSNSPDTLTLNRCVLEENNAFSRGGGIYSTAVTSIDHCTLYGNRSSSSGGGIWVESGSNTSIDNSIIAFGPDGEAVGCGGTATLRCSDIYANLDGNWVGCIAGQLGINDNFSANPLFCDAQNRDFTIRGTSPCAPANSPGECGLIGALPVGCGVSGVASDAASGVSAYLTVMPNPVRGLAEFAFEYLPGSRMLDVFDSQGRLIDRVDVNEGSRLFWSPGPSIASGVYFARLNGGAAHEMVKFLYLRR